MKQKKMLIVVGIVACALVGLFLLGQKGLSSKLPKAKTTMRIVRGRGLDRRSAKDAVRAAVGTRKQVRNNTSGEKKKLEGDYSKFSPADRKIAKALQDALDDDDFDAVMLAAEKAAHSSEPELRQNAVEALGWYGEDALPELTVLMSDKDEDVAQAAMNQWELAASEIDDSARQFAVTMAAFSTLKDRDALTMLGGLVANAATDIIDSDDDHADENRLMVVQALTDIIEGGSPVNAEQAKEVYSDVTGNDWVSVDEAEKYLLNPDNYEAPESDEEKED